MKVSVKLCPAALFEARAGGAVLDDYALGRDADFHTSTAKNRPITSLGQRQ